jgi:hypothetical protein
MAGKWSLKQIFLRTLIVALVGSALVGIYAFLFGDFGETEAKILLTTLTISYFSVISLACAAAFEAKKGIILGLAGLAVSLLGFLGYVPGIWAEWFENEAYGKSMIILGIFAFSIAQTCLLALVPLQKPLRWCLYATGAIIFALALLISGMLVFESDEEWLFRLTGVLGILDGCGTVLIPVLYKLRGKPVEETPSGSLDQIELLCPRCEHRGTYPVGAITCEECSLELRVEITKT